MVRVFENDGRAGPVPNPPRRLEPSPPLGVHALAGVGFVWFLHHWNLLTVGLNGALQ
jgi:hypothetical protein